MSISDSPFLYRTRTFLLAAIFVFAIVLGCNKGPAPATPDSNQASMSSPGAKSPSPAHPPATPPPVPRVDAPDTYAPPPTPKATRPPARHRPPQTAGDRSPASGGQHAMPPPPPPPPPVPETAAAPAGESSPSQRDSNIVRVYYATDRQDRGTPQSPIFGPDENTDGKLAYGVAEVSIPKDHRMGNLEEPILDIKILYNPAKYVTVLSSAETDENTFFTRLKNQVDGAPQKEVLVFIHGFNVTFGRALRRTAQLSYDLQFPGATICYSWPSRGSLFAYTADEDTVQWTAMHLLNFLQDVYQRSGATSIHIIAHSMGNRALLSALQLLGTSPAPQFGEVVLAAPDVASSLFTQLVPTVQKHAKRITLYASSRDQALVASARVNHYRRAGDSNGTVTIIPPVETIDASSVDTGFLGHSYFGDNSSVLSDLYYLLKDGFPASKRSRLEQKTVQMGTYWAFRP